MFGMVLGRFRSASGQLAAWRCWDWPHWVWPLAVCAVFIAAGLLVLEDYPSR